MKLIRALALVALTGLPLPALAQNNPADAISNEVFGPRNPVDYAYGAYQRGYYLTALELALPRAEQGDAAAQTLIAELYARGLGVAQNAERAAGWYQLASKNGDRLATFELGMLYQAGTGVPRKLARGIEHLSELALVQLKEVLDVYSTRSAEKANAIRERDEEIDAMYTSLFRELLTYMMEDPRNITTCTHLLFCAKNIERIGDHATNIAETIYYMTTGSQPEGERPKDDSSNTLGSVTE